MISARHVQLFLLGVLALGLAVAVYLTAHAILSIQFTGV